MHSSLSIYFKELMKLPSYLKKKMSLLQYPRRTRHHVCRDTTEYGPPLFAPPPSSQEYTRLTPSADLDRGPSSHLDPARNWGPRFDPGPNFEQSLLGMREIEAQIGRCCQCSSRLGKMEAE